MIHKAFGNCALRRMRTHAHHIHGRCKIFCHVHRRFLEEGVVVRVEDQRRIFHKVQGIQGACGNAIRAQDQGISFGQWRRVHVQSIHKFFLLDHGIAKETSPPYRPQQNGVVERAYRTIVEMARSMIHVQKLDKSFWAEAVVNAVYTRNRCPTTALERMTPEET